MNQKHEFGRKSTDRNARKKERKKHPDNLFTGSNPAIAVEEFVHSLKYLQESNHKWHIKNNIKKGTVFPIKKMDLFCGAGLL